MRANSRSAAAESRPQQSRPMKAIPVLRNFRPARHVQFGLGAGMRRRSESCALQAAATVAPDPELTCVMCVVLQCS